MLRFFFCEGCKTVYKIDHRGVMEKPDALSRRKLWNRH
jgi:hypothetical protein